MPYSPTLALAPMVMVAALVKVPDRLYSPLVVERSMLICPLPPEAELLKVAWFRKPKLPTLAIAPMLMVAALVKVAEEPVLYSPLAVERSMLICPPSLSKVASLNKPNVPTPVSEIAPMVMLALLVKVPEEPVFQSP